MKTNSYRFILPNIQKKLIGTQGEQARCIPYRLEEGITPESILRELRRQPHMARLADCLDAKRRLYLLDSADTEQLFLAAEYIGTYHRLVNSSYDCYGTCDMEDGDGADEDEAWRDGDCNARSFNFSAGLPFLMNGELQQFYFPSEGFGFGNQMYRPDMTPQKRPWWTMSDDAPMVISMVEPDQGSICFSGCLSSLPRLLETLKGRSLLIILHCSPKRDQQDTSNAFGGIQPDWGESMTMDDLSFELETDYIRLDTPGQESRYKRDILRQLAREKGTPLDRRASALKILSLVEEHRGNTDNRTIAKAVSNALLRRRSTGPLQERDFAYLSSVFPSRGKRGQSQPDSMELVGQPEIRRRLEQVVESMTFQKRRRAMGLPCSPIHYTFAFMGPPGTGKSSWARWLAAEMEKRGLLPGSSFIAINAAELKAKYVGHTTGKVKALFQQYNAILLDEAYSLAEGEGDDSFAREALAQLCIELEDHAEDRLVIFAGYGGSSNPEDNRMLRFLQSNPGINSRVAFRVYFQDFQPRELTQVLRAMLSYECYTLPPEAESAAEDFFRRRAARRAFGNCREARNLADRIKLHAAARLADGASTREGLSLLLLRDVEEAAAEILEEYQTIERDAGRSIGFSCPAPG